MLKGEWRGTTHVKRTIVQHRLECLICSQLLLLDIILLFFAFSLRINLSQGLDTCGSEGASQIGKRVIRPFGGETLAPSCPSQRSAMRQSTAISLLTGCKRQVKYS
eukprot:1976916-Amphidinium_carterae.2